jgi:hydroxyacylglutathione hydrolase
MPQSTLGYEKLFNWAFAVGDEDEFVQQVLAGQPDPPPYFARMKRINKEGPPLLGVPRTPAEEAAGGIRDALARGDIVLDLRAAPAFAAGHVPGTINIPLAKSFTGWAGWLVPYDRDVHLVAAHEADAARAARDLAMIGIDRVAGWFPLEALESWTASGGALDTIAQLTADELRARLRSADVVVLDVRSSAEWHAGHIPGVRNLPVGTLPLHVAELPANRPIVLHCQGGTRSAIAASILQSHGRRVLNYPGGFAEWVGLGMPVERE